MYAKFISIDEVELLQYPFEIGEKVYQSSFDLDEEAEAKIAELGYKPLVQRGAPMSVYPLKRVFEDQGERIFGSWVEDKEAGEDAEQVKKVQQHIRARREVECFPVINRGELWYNMLWDEQKAELAEWYTAWLNAPETLATPEKPDWLK